MQNKKLSFSALVSAFAGPGPKAFFRRLQCGLRFLPGLVALSFLQWASAAVPLAADIQTPATGDHALHIVSPNLLELFLVNTKQPDPARVNIWDWVDNQQNFVAPDM